LGLGELTGTLRSSTDQSISDIYHHGDPASLSRLLEDVASRKLLSIMEAFSEEEREDETGKWYSLFECSNDAHEHDSHSPSRR
jgi:hypothetical protein